MGLTLVPCGGGELGGRAMAMAAGVILLVLTCLLQPVGVAAASSSPSSIVAVVVVNAVTRPMLVPPQIAGYGGDIAITQPNSSSSRLAMAAPSRRRSLLQAPPPPSSSPTSARSRGNCVPPAGTSTLSEFVCMSVVGSGVSFHWGAAAGSNVEGRDPDRTVVRMAVQVQKPVSWLSVGWSPNAQMAGDCVIWSVNDGVAAGDGRSNGSNQSSAAPQAYRILAKSRDGIVPSREFQILDWRVEDDAAGGSTRTTLSFGRRLGDGDVKVTPSGPNRMIWAHSEDGASSLSFHGPYAGGFDVDFGNGAVDGVSSQASGAGGAGGAPRSFFAAHAWLMWIAFGVLFPAGLFLARYGKASAPAWFHLHVGCQLAGVATSTIAAGISIVEFDALDGTHGRLGLAVMILVWLQPSIALVRPHKGVAIRVPWYVQHWMCGTGAVFLGSLNVFLGIDALTSRTTEASHLASLRTAYAVQVALLFFLYLLLNDWQYTLSQGEPPSPPPSPKPQSAEHRAGGSTS